VSADILPNLREIERKQHFVEIADDLSNIILEIRRYEKNYLLYASATDLEEIGVIFSRVSRCSLNLHQK